MKTIVFLRAKDGTDVGTAEIDTDDGDTTLLQADTGEMYVSQHDGSVFYVAAIPLAVIVKRAGT